MNLTCGANRAPQGSENSFICDSIVFLEETCAGSGKLMKARDSLGRIRSPILVLGVSLFPNLSVVCTNLEGGSLTVKNPIKELWQWCHSIC